MKYSPTVSSSRRKARKAHFTSDSEARRVLMSSRLSKELRAKHAVRAVPIRKDDEVVVKKGEFKGRDGVVKAVYRRKFVIHIDRLTRDKNNGTPVDVGVHPSNVEITKLKMDKDRQAMLEKKKGARSRITQKYQSTGGSVDVSNMKTHTIRGLLQKA